MAKKATRTTAKSPKKAAATTPKKTPTRKLKQAKYQSFKLQKRIKANKPNISSSFRLLVASLSLLKKHWMPFAGITSIYLVLSLLLVKGVGTVMDVGQLKQLIETSSASNGRFAATLEAFGVLAGGANTPSSDVAGAYQSMLLVVISLVVIWTLRQVMAGSIVTTRDAFYKGLYPLVPFLLVLMIIGIQLLPLVIGGLIFSLVIASSTIVLTALELGLFILLVFLLVLWSLYMVTASIFGLYIVTLPDMRPIQALRSAKQLVHYRRWTVMRKLLFLPLVLLLLGIIIMVPVIMFLTPVAEWIFFGLSMISLAVVHAYIYNLYRELL